MNIIRMIKKIPTLFDHTDEKVKAIYKEPMKQVTEVNKSMKEVNKLLCHKSVTYKIAQAVGSI